MVEMVTRVVTRPANDILALAFETSRYLGVNPEGEPGDNDEHTGGDVDGEHVVRELTLQRQLHQQAAVLP